jgi:hypothetical protein
MMDFLFQSREFNFDQKVENMFQGFFNWMLLDGIMAVLTYLHQWAKTYVPHTT